MRAAGAGDHAEGRFAGAGGLKLYYQRWRPGGIPAQAVVINLHGLGDHSGMHVAVVDYLVAAGFAVYAPDLRGHGRSPGQRAYLQSWSEYREDLGEFVRLVREREPAPLFLVGHSLGGLVVLDYAETHPAHLHGVVAVSPPLGAVGVAPWLMTLGRLMSRVFPRFSLQVGMDLSGLSRDPAVVEQVLADPLFHRRGTARLAAEVPAAIARVHERAGELVMPLLLMHGTADRLTSPEGSRRLFERVAHSDKTLCLYDGAYHALFVDLDAERALRDLEHWLRRHL